MYFNEFWQIYTPLQLLLNEDTEYGFFLCVFSFAPLALSDPDTLCPSF